MRQHIFWTREKLSQEEAETVLIAEVIDEIFEEPANEAKEAIGDPTRSEILGDKVQPALTSKDADKQDDKNQQGATVDGKEDTCGNLTLEVQGKKAADDIHPKMICRHHKGRTVKSLKMK